MTSVLNAADLRIDPGRWPDVAQAPKPGARARIAAPLFRRITERLAVRVAYPDGTVTGTTGPTMRVVRPQAFFARLGAHGLIGFGESYQAGEWTATTWSGC